MIARLVLAWRLVAWGMALAVLAGSLWPSMPSIPGGLSDKTLHFFAYVALALVFTAAFSRRHWLAIALGLAVFGAVIELLQHWLPGRRAGEWLDLGSNLAGIATGMAAALMVPHGLRHKLDRVLGRAEGEV